MSTPGIVVSYNDGVTDHIVRFEHLLDSTSLSYLDESSLSFSTTGTPVVSGSTRGVTRTWNIAGWLKDADIRILLNLWEAYRAKEATGEVAVVEISDETFPYSPASPLTAQAVIEISPERPGPGSGPFWFPASIGLTEV
ncbi:predicted protein [Cyanophage PSS2]|uniref:tail tape measure protein n=1 Tax=Cyanophage PSS2 TaxID=658401 RepID=UPI0001B04024|nr:tail tape measure protein [Cyanophage PSS2]ACT65640.1 tail tape measure protein [Cyanophage PSS2]ACY75781.1 predicted protein [Cyanophage PSS2]